MAKGSIDHDRGFNRWGTVLPICRALTTKGLSLGSGSALVRKWLLRLPVAVIDDGRYRTSFESGRMDRRPLFHRLEGEDVVWHDGQRERLDALILATGFRPNLPYLEHSGALDSDGAPIQENGLSTTMPGLGFVGIEFQRSFSSNTVRGCGRDARYVVDHLKATMVAAPKVTPVPA